MTGLSKITDKILSEAQIDARRTLADADKKCEEIIARYKKEADAAAAAIDAEAEKEAERIVTRTKTEAGIIRKNLINNAKTALVEQVFKDAEQEILALSNEKYLEFLTDLLISVLKEVYADKDAGKIEVMLSEKDRDKHGKAMLEGAARRLIGKIDSKLLDGVTLSGKAAAISGGLLLVTEKCDFNCSVELLMEKARLETEGSIQKILF